MINTLLFSNRGTAGFRKGGLGWEALSGCGRIWAGDTGTGEDGQKGISNVVSTYYPQNPVPPSYWQPLTLVFEKDLTELDCND